MEQSNIFPDVYNQIYQCLSIKNPKSFFLFAGAGTGKTRALVHTLKQFRLEQGKQLRLCGKKVAVITYTNAACDEIKSRLEYDDTFVISTIHSFSWDLIKPFQNDIRDWVKRNLEIDIIELVEKQSKGRSSKVSSERELQIESKQKRLEYLDHIEKFTYEPNGLNDTKDSLNHNEVISMTAEFLAKKDLLQKILIQQYPILLIDESQDTKKELIEAFFQIQTKYSHSFSLGLLGDTMQRIYFDGKPDLGKFLPDDWLKPNLKINYRSAKRIIVLINRIRSEQAQIPSEGKEEGFVRFFIVNVKGDLDKNSIEQGIMKNMEAITQDEGWLREVKILTLEHNMAARRGGFIEFFEPLYRIEKCKKGLLDGTLPCVSLFLQQIIPLLKAKESKNEFSVAQIMRKYSPLLNLKDFEASSKQIDNIKQADNGVRDLFNLVNGVNKPTLLEILKKIKSSNLFNIPDFLLPILNCNQFDSYITANESDKDEELEAWRQALSCRIEQVINYGVYISDESRFGTHQGIKGLEFPRVMVVMDDDEARGFWFSYDKLFGVKGISTTDQKNIDEGKETSIDRTRRLFYVTCSRAEKSLALVAYTSDPNKVKNTIIDHGWFNESEIVTI